MRARRPPPRTDDYRHVAALYGDPDELVSAVVPFVRDALTEDQAVLLALDPQRSRALRAMFQHEAEVHFLDPQAFGPNPTWLIPAWEQFVNERTAPGQRARIVGDLMLPNRPPREVVECERHEALSNVAFSNRVAWALCLYEATTLDPALIEGVRRTHPYVWEKGQTSMSSRYAGVDAILRPFAEPLPEPPPGSRTVRVDRGSLAPARRRVATLAMRAGMAPPRVEELVMAVNELATNAVRHGSGWGELELWTERGAVVCEVRGSGRIDDPLVGRRRPTTADAADGRGLWITNQLCDLVQIRSFPTGGVVRVVKFVP